jgi:hypothetical protein
MDTQKTADQGQETAFEASALLQPSDTEHLMSTVLREVSDDDFEEVVRGALEAVGGTLLFKMKVGAGGEALHAAAAAVGQGTSSRQFLLLTLPTQGGQLKVETTSRSSSPLAGIAESYAGLMDVLKAAA